jgi:putative DNA primase/helicase
MSIAPERRFSSSRPCPICGGHPNLRRGNSERCYGFLSEDGQWAHRTREEYAGGLEYNSNSGTYPHKMTADCRCGVQHGQEPPEVGRNGSDRRGKIAETYQYRDAREKLLYEVVRFDPKGFAQRRLDGRGGYIWNLDGVERVLYRLPELLAANRDETVYLPEGEKDVDLLTKLGLVATTNPEGAGKWRDEYTPALKGWHVVILQDNDEEGRKHAEMAARALYGEAASVKVVVLPGLPEKGDVSDWLNAGNSVGDLRRIVDETPQWEPHSSTDDTPDEFDEVGTLLSDVVEESVEWLWEGRIPLGKLTVIDGDPGTGKSALTIDLAARVSTGREMPTPKEEKSDD